MARYTEAVCRLCRRSGEKLFLKGNRCFTPKCGVDRRPTPPGPKPSRRPKLSERGIQLREKQSARYVYGIMERQFRRFFDTAAKQAGVTGENLMVLLERRLDSVVYRLGFADSRSQARQLIRHGHIRLNGKRTDVPSYLVKEGDKISWRPESTKSVYYKQLVEVIKSKTVPNWLSLDRENLTGEVLSVPTSVDVEALFDGTAIVEYYSR